MSHVCVLVQPHDDLWKEPSIGNQSKKEKKKKKNPLGTNHRWARQTKSFKIEFIGCVSGIEIRCNAIAVKGRDLKLKKWKKEKKKEKRRNFKS